LSANWACTRASSRISTSGTASEGGSLHARPLGWKSSGDLCGLAGVNALLQILPQSSAAPKCLLLDLA